MTYQNLQRLIIILIIVPLSIWAVWKGFSNEKDPLWQETADLLHNNIVTLDKSPDSLNALFHNFHGSEWAAASDTAVMDLINKPYPPTMTFEKFKSFFNLVAERKFIIMSGVTGAGNTTLVDRIANLISNETVSNTETSRKMEILCAPQFDLDLHHRYIGFFDKKTFIKGDLLKFWDRCRAQPKQRFACLIDNFDKINPETFFGPELWQKLDDAKYPVVFGSDTVKIPDNFYLLCVTHAGVGQKIEMNNEHFKRFGGLVNLPPTAAELVLALKSKKKEVEKDLSKKKEAPQYDGQKKDLDKLEKQLASLTDTSNLQRFVYFFSKTNEFISEKYSSSHQLGQWSDVRKQYQLKDFDNLQDIFINHINAFHPQAELKKADFEPILYTINNGGQIEGSSPIWRAVKTLGALGFASELGVAGSFALISALFGWWYFRRRHQYIKDFTIKINELMSDYHLQLKSCDQVAYEIDDLKRTFDELVLSQKVNYNEASFIYSFLEDKMRVIQIAREINESFLKLMDAFLEDDVLSDSEYAKLKQFLESMRFKITTPQYHAYKRQIEETYQQFGV
jgi:hypothetical protein